jgi:hypothetical protein
VGSSKNLLTNHKARRAQIYTKAFLNTANSSLYKSWSPGLEGATMGKHNFTCVYCGEKKSFLQNQQANFNQTWYKFFLGKSDLRFYKSKVRSSSKGI